MPSEIDDDATDWLARWNGIASRDGLRLTTDGDRWRLDPLSTAGPMTEPEAISISDEVTRLPDGRVLTRRMTREEVEAFFGPDDGPI